MCRAGGWVTYVMGSLINYTQKQKMFNTFKTATPTQDPYCEQQRVDMGRDMTPALRACISYVGGGPEVQQELYYLVKPIKRIFNFFFSENSITTQHS